MESKGIITVAVTVTVAVIVLAGILMPVLTDATKTEDTFTNTGYFRMSEVKEDTVVMAWDHTNPTVFTVDGVEVDLSDLSSQFAWGSQISVAFSDGWIVRYVMQGTTKLIQLYNQYGGYLKQVSSTGEYDLTLTITESSMIWSDTSTASDTTLSNTVAWTLDANGDHIMKKNNGTAYLLKESSIIYAGGITAVGGTTLGLYFYGTVEDGYDFTYHSADPNIQIQDVVSVYDEVSGYVDLISLSKITFNVVSGDNTTAVTYSYFLVPYEVTAERSVHFTDSMNGLLAVIPILILVGVLLGVAAVVLRNRM